MKQKIRKQQVEAINEAFHKVWFAVMFDRPETKSEDTHSLSFMDMHLIGIAEESPGYILREIRKILNVPQTTLSSIVSKLEKMGFIRRVINPRDMRSFSIEVTDKGRRMHLQHKMNDFEKAEHVLQLLDEGERDDFIRLFRKVADGMRRHDSEKA
jgi:DNA-binding MarR family transcriptional regulator